MKRWYVLVSLITACGKVASKSPDAAMGGSDAPPIDSKSIDASTICDPTKAFDAPVPLPSYSMNGVAEGTTRLSQDELTMYISGRLQGEADVNIYVATRATTADMFGYPATELANINGTANDWDPTISTDQKTIIFGTTRTSGNGTDLYVATRSSTLADFGTPAPVATIQTLTDDDVQPFLTADGSELWFASNRSGTAGMHDIYYSTITGGSFGTPVRVAELSSTSDEWTPVLSADKLTIYFGTMKPGTGTLGYVDIWTSHRTSVSSTWPTPTPVVEVNTTGFDVPAFLSADNCRLYYWSTATDTIGNVYVAVRHP